MLSFMSDNIWKKNSQKAYQKGYINFGHGNFVVIRISAIFRFNVKQKIKDFWIKYKPNLKSKRFWYRFFLVFLGGIVAGILLLIFLFVWFSKDLPSPNRVVRRDGFSSRIYDRNGEVIYDLYKDAKRIPVTWEEIPESLKKATIAVEDKDFYKHQGFDPLTPFRIIKNVFYFKKLTGGSTLTQQLVKNVLLTSEVSLNRKLKELILSIQIEAKYSKDEILLMYLNEAPYGGASVGVGSAAEQYFNKKVSELTSTESVILAGLPQRPSVYSPFSKTPKAYVERSAHVLDRMVDDGYLGRGEADNILKELSDYKFYENKSLVISPHFVLWVKEKLTEKYGEEMVEGGGLKITTTLDLNLQKKVEEIVADEVSKAAKLGVSNGAAIVLDPSNGQVLAMAGSRDYYSKDTDGMFNVVTNSLRQPGSAIKPVTYLVGLKNGFTASSLIMDTPVVFPGEAGQKDYAPQNYNGKFNGPISLRNALGNSINTTAVKMLAMVGLQNMLKQAYDMGLTTLEPTTENLKRFGLAVTLGGAEVRMIDLAKAYSSFANGGKKVEEIGVLKVEDKNGKVLEEFRQIDGKQVMTPQEAFIISNILSDNSAREYTFGSVNSLNIPGYQVAVKTGTTNDKRDNWAIGWTPNLLVTTWVGNNDNSPMGKIASGVSGATPIWRKIMLAALPGRNKQDFPIPDKIINIEVDRVSGYPAHDGFPSRPDYFVDGSQQRNSDPIHKKVKVCKNSEGLATPEDISNGSYDEKEFFVFKEDDPVSKDGKNRWQEGIDKWINEQADKSKYFPPTEFCRSGGLLVANIDSPSDRSTVGNNVSIKIRTEGLRKVTEVKVWIDGAEKITWTEKPFETNMNIPDGPHTIKVKVTDKDGNISEKESKFGVNVPWDWSPSPIPSPTLVPTVTPVPTVVVIPTGI